MHKNIRNWLLMSIKLKKLKEKSIKLHKINYLMKIIENKNLIIYKKIKNN